MSTPSYTSTENNPARQPAPAQEVGRHEMRISCEEYEEGRGRSPQRHSRLIERRSISRGRNEELRQRSKSSMPPFYGSCYTCNVTGHRASECPNEKQRLSSIHKSPRHEVNQTKESESDNRNTQRRSTSLKSNLLQDTLELLEKMQGLPMRTQERVLKAVFREQSP